MNDIRFGEPLGDVTDAASTRARYAPRIGVDRDW